MYGCLAGIDSSWKGFWEWQSIRGSCGQCEEKERSETTFNHLSKVAKGISEAKDGCWFVLQECDTQVELIYLKWELLCYYFQMI